jgi:cytochrome oxidase Cu insertion factor (SCO1/SenC/PrrC family)
MRKTALKGILGFALLAFLANGAFAADRPLRAVAEDNRPARFGNSNKGAPEIGAECPDFTLKDAKGNSVTLSGFRGKSVFVMELGACT